MYYVLEKDNGPGCPSFLNAMLHENFIEKGASVPIEYPWYFTQPSEPTHPLPPELFFITKDKKYSFDFATDFGGHIVSHRFLEKMQLFDLSAWEISKLKAVDQKKSPVSENKYYFIRQSRKLWISEAIDTNKSILEKRKNGEIKKISKLVLKDEQFPEIFCTTEISLSNIVFFGENFVNKIKPELWHGFKVSPCENAGLIKPA